MSIAIIFNNKDPQIWKTELEHKLPGTTVEVYPDIKDKKQVDFILCWKPKKGVIAEFPNVKVVQSVGASAEQILFSQDLSESILVARIVDEQLSADMFEFLLSVLLLKMKNLDLYIDDQHAGIWNPAKYASINSTNVTVLGLGEIGQHVARRLASLDFKVRGWSRSEKQIEKVHCFFGKAGYVRSMRDADFLINLLPLTPDTRDILDSDSMSLLKPGATLINVGRGEHLIEQDLLNALDSGHLSGAVLDVFREEPLPASHPFWNHPAITITPHIASLTNVSTAVEVVAENYRRARDKQELLFMVSRANGY